jgi:hypothetical protein
MAVGGRLMISDGIIILVGNSSLNKSSVVTMRALPRERKKGSLKLSLATLKSSSPDDNVIIVESILGSM